MKKIITLFLVATLSFSVVACGGKEGEVSTDVSQQVEETNEANTQAEQETTVEDIRIEKDDDLLTIYATKEQIAECLKKVTITKDNWSEYFADYEEHIVETNDFGDVVSDRYEKGFGLKRDVYAVFDKVSFKFDGKTQMLDEDTYLVYKAGSDIRKFYNVNGELESEEYCENKEYYLVELTNGHGDFGQYKEHECIDAIGEIIVIDLPLDEPYYNSVNVQFPDGSMTGFIGFSYSGWEGILEE